MPRPWSDPCVGLGPELAGSVLKLAGELARAKLAGVAGLGPDLAQGLILMYS